jgi:hypothetical protein
LKRILKIISISIFNRLCRLKNYRALIFRLNLNRADFIEFTDIESDIEGNNNYCIKIRFFWRNYLPDRSKLYDFFFLFIFLIFLRLSSTVIFSVKKSKFSIITVYAERETLSNLNNFYIQTSQFLTSNSIDADLLFFRLSHQYGGVIAIFEFSIYINREDTAPFSFNIDITQRYQYISIYLNVLIYAPGNNAISLYIDIFRPIRSEKKKRAIINIKTFKKRRSAIIDKFYGIA